VKNIVFAEKTSHKKTRPPCKFILKVNPQEYWFYEHALFIKSSQPFGNLAPKILKPIADNSSKFARTEQSCSLKVAPFR